jgi:arylsulfatase A-like enzyme
LRVAFESAGLLDGTVLAITSDHGTEFFEHGAKGHRQTLYDESIRVPMIVRYPSRISAGKRVQAQTRCIDVGPTLLDLAGLPKPSDVMGESLMPMVGATGARDRRAVSELFSVGRNMRAVRTREWKWIDFIAVAKSACFDLARDPAERSPVPPSGSTLGKTAELGYLEAVAVMKKFVEEHPISTRESQVPDEVKRQLDALGY